MERYLVLVLISSGACSKLDPIPPVSHESDLAKHEQYYLNNYGYLEDYNNFDRIQQHGKLKSRDDGNDDLAKIDNYYDKYIESKRASEEYQINRQGYNEEAMKAKLDKTFGYTGPTANDEPENLQRPCALDDWACIRNYFAANGKCKPGYGLIPDPLYVDVLSNYLPVANLKLTSPDAQIRGLSSAKVREFYVNKQSGNLVFAIDVQNLNQTYPRTYFRYRRTGKESIILAGFATVEFRSATFTAVIPSIPDLRLDLADIHADIQDGAPPFFISPEATTSTDPDVVTAFEQLVSNVPVAIREGVLFQTQLITSIYIQKNICDFGLTFISA